MMEADCKGRIGIFAYFSPFFLEIFTWKFKK